MASDIPDSGYASSFHMARVLATYMTDPAAIRRRVLEDFDKAPAEITISIMRKDYLATKGVDPNPCTPHDGYWPQEESKKAEHANSLFLHRLKIEREASALLRVA